MLGTSPNRARHEESMHKQFQAFLGRILLQLLESTLLLHTDVCSYQLEFAFELYQFALLNNEHGFNCFVKNPSCHTKIPCNVCTITYTEKRISLTTWLFQTEILTLKLVCKFQSGVELQPRAHEKEVIRQQKCGIHTSKLLIVPFQKPRLLPITSY